MQLSSLENVRRHVGTVHGIKYPCDQCEFKATKEALLIVHKKKHQKIVYSCNVCSFQTKNKQSLKVHTETLHDGLKHSLRYEDLFY